MSWLLCLASKKTALLLIVLLNYCVATKVHFLIEKRNIKSKKKETA